MFRSIALFTLFTAALTQRLEAQEPVKSVAEGVYSDVQAARGAAAYDGACGRCHRQDLGGADGPALKDERFNRNFAGKDLKTLYTRVATTMPRGAPGSLAGNLYLDIVAYMLKENGFPPSSRELHADGLEGVQVLPTQLKPLPPVSDFSYVEVAGCFTSAPDGTWQLLNASDPIAVAPPGSPHQAIAQTSSSSVPSVGTQSFKLLDAMAYDPASHVGHTLRVRGLLIRLRDEQRITISSLDTVASSCAR